MSKPEDIFGIVNTADTKYFGDWKRFEKRYIRQEDNGRYVKNIGVMNLDELRDKVQNIVLRRTENEVSIQLPDVIEKRIDCDIDSTQLAIQEFIKEDGLKMRDKLDKIKAKPNKSTEDTTAIISLEGSLKGLIAASQACADDPRLFSMSKSEGMKKKFMPLIPNSYKSSSKYDALIELVNEILDSDQKVIIFSRFERAIDLIKADLDRALKCDVLTYTGDTTEEQREINVELFENSMYHNVIAGTDALSVGWTKGLALTS